MSRRLGDIRMRDPFILTLASGGFVLYGTTDTNLWGGRILGGHSVLGPRGARAR